MAQGSRQWRVIGEVGHALGHPEATGSCAAGAHDALGVNVFYIVFTTSILEQLARVNQPQIMTLHQAA